MTSSFEGSAIQALLQKADTLAPDYSCKVRSIASDVEVMAAPVMIGKLFALKQLLKQEEMHINSNGPELRRNRSDQSLCDQLASFEFRAAVEHMARPEAMVTRNNGMIVDTSCMT